MIDLSHLNMIKTAFENQQFIMLIELYIKDSLDLLARCNHHLQNQDFEHLSESAHALKGSSSNLGIQDIFDYSKELEKYSKNNDLLSSIKYVKLLNENFPLVVKELNNFLKSSNIN